MFDAIDAWLSRFPNLLVLGAGILLLVNGGNWLVRGAVVIANRLGLSTLLIGLTVVAFGTSAPELAFNLIAALSGNTELCFGNVIGSNIANVCLVVGISAVAKPLVVASRVIRKELPYLIAVTIGAIVLAFSPPHHQTANGATIYAFSWPHGLILLTAFAGFLFAWTRLARQGKSDVLAIEAAEVAEEDQAGLGGFAATMLLALGLGALFLGGKFTEVGAVGLARWLGMSEAMIGLTVVAVATSLPEIFASAIAAAKGYTDMAIGNVIGSNLFNLLLVLGVTSVVAPVPVPPGRGAFDLAFMGGVTLLLVPLGITRDNRITRGEGFVLLCIYGAYIGLSIVLDPGVAG